MTTKHIYNDILSVERKFCKTNFPVKNDFFFLFVWKHWSSHVITALYQKKKKKLRIRLQELRQLFLWICCVQEHGSVMEPRCRKRQGGLWTCNSRNIWTANELALRYNSDHGRINILRELWKPLMLTRLHNPVENEKKRPFCLKKY